MAGLELEPVGPDAVEHLPGIPRLLAALNGCMIGRKSAIVRQAGPVLEQ
jgi:hypothetical protein